MLHIITLHFTTPAWLEIQKRHIEKYTTRYDPNTGQQNYKVWLGFYNQELPSDFVVPTNWETIDLNKLYPPDGRNEHYLQTEWMYHNIVKDNMKDDDILVFMDSDAFPVIPHWASELQGILTDNQGRLMNTQASRETLGYPEVVGIYQLENRGIAQTDNYYPAPDLCFFATTKKVWEEKQLQWTIDPSNPEHQNPAFGLLDIIREKEVRECKLMRTNIFDAHNVMFGVYGNMIYHQACGSRAIIGRPLETAGAKAETSRHCFTGYDIFGRQKLGNWYREDFIKKCSDIVETNTQIFDVIYNRLQEDLDCEFVRRYFLGIP
tara:strand:- start:9063 stop:10022 length:960 start_codon:yes stop_codon:yes gene_type:complete